MNPTHRLLQRQLKRHLGETANLPPGWQAFIEAVNNTYHDSDADRAMLDHSLELCSAELLAANSELRTLFEAMPDPVLHLSRDGAVLDIKGGSEGDWLTRRHEWIGRKLADTPLYTVADQFSEAIRQVVAGNGPVNIEYSAVSLGLETYYEARLVPLLDSQIVVIIRDITERKQSLRLLAAAVEQSAESIVITDTELDHPGPRILFVNSTFTKLTGYSAAEAIGKTPRIVQGPKTDPATLRRLRETLARGEIFKGEAINYRKDGSEYNLEWEIVPLRNSQGKVTHYLGMQRNISARKNAEARLEELNKDLLEASRLAGMAEVATGVLHNVGNVLNSVNVASACVADKLKKSKSGDLGRLVALLREHEKDLGRFFTQHPKAQMVPAYLEKVASNLAQEQAESLTELAELEKNINHIKVIVRTQQGLAKVAATKENINVTELIEDALRMNSSGLTRNQIQIIREFQHTPNLLVEKHKVLQILINLVRNARQACGDLPLQGRKLTLRTSCHGDRVHIDVRDNGAGILPENLDRIFTHGFTTKKEGHGFGLNSAAAAAKSMGATLRVHSDGPGLGATFTLELPMNPDSASCVPECNATR